MEAGKVTCPNCSLTFAAAVKFCPHDGTPLGMNAAPAGNDPRRCPSCGALYRAGRFCIQDGTMLEAAS